jgi:hypothetical protein
MGDAVTSEQVAERAAVAIAVPGKSTIQSGDVVAPPTWALTDGFSPAVDKAMLAGHSPLELTRAFLGGVGGDRVALHHSLEDGFSTAVTLADPVAYKSIADKIATHFAQVAEASDAIHAELKGRGLGVLASIVSRANGQEAERLNLTIQLQAVRQRMASKQYEADAELKREADSLKERLSALTVELNESFSELRCEAEDLE